MLQRSHRVLLAVSLLATCWLALMSQQAGGQTQGTKPPVVVAAPNGGYQYGRVTGSVLWQYAPDDLKPACKQLMRGDVIGTAPFFRKAYEKDNNNLAAYVGLAQAAPESLPKDIPHFWEILKKNPDNAQVKFCLGTALFYHIMSLSPNDRILLLNGKTSDRSEIVGFMQDAWHKLETPLTAFMLLEVSFMCQNKVDNKFVFDTLITHLGGKAVQQSWQNARKSNFTVHPPDVTTVPANNLESLNGVVLYLWSWSGTQTGTFVPKDGKKTVQWDPLTPEQQRVVRYYDDWHTAIKKRLKSVH